MKRYVISRAVSPRAVLAAALAWSLALVPPGLHAQQASIRGVVAELNTAARIDRATVLLLGPNGAVHQAELSDSAGQFEIPVPATGYYVLRVYRAGYNATKSDVIAVPADGVVDVRVNLRPNPLMLEALEVRGEAPVRTRQLREFAKRREQRRGYNFDRADIARMNAGILTDVLQKVPGFRREGTVRQPTVSITPARCPPKVFVDGAWVPSSGEDFWVLGTLPMHLVSGIEVFTTNADMPIEYRSTSRCGLILIWTKAMR